MWYGLYNALLLLGFPVIVSVLLIKRRCRSSLWQRMGWGWRAPREWHADDPVIWVHAVSLGEVSAIVPFVMALRRRYPDVRIVVSTITETGREAVVRRLAGVATHCFLPLDYPWSIRRVLGPLNLLGLIIVETEIWPNVLRALHRRGVPSVLVNGRISSRSFARYRWIRPFMRRVLSTVSLGLLQSRRDEDRFVALGAVPARMHSTGNMKCDVSFEESASAPHAGAVDRSTFGLSPDDTLMVAGSTHPSEEVILLECYRAVARHCPHVILLLAPRHIERSDALARTIRSFGFPVIRRSLLPNDMPRGDAAHGPRVILLDTRGELARVYGLAAMTFVGGTLAPVGGHNLLEPAAWAKPVCFGPHTDHCQDVAEWLLDAGGGLRVRNVRELTDVWMKGAREPEWASRVGQCARRVIDDHRGVVERNVEMIERVIGARGPSSPARHHHTDMTP